MNYLAARQVIGYMAGNLGFNKLVTVLTNPADFLKGEGNGMFDGMIETAKETFASAYQLITIISFGVAVLSLIFAAICVMVTKKAEKKSDNKNWILGILVGVAVVSGAITLVGLFYGLGQKL